MIKGLTDTLIMRRDGKIRAGYKDENNKNQLMNPKHFLLHDAPQLIPVLGEDPKEIYFTVYCDDIQQVARNDLRWYSKSELMCLGDGESAAYFSNLDAANVKQKPHPRFAKSRERICAYRHCPDYMSGNCSEHLFLDMVVPQYSMASMFTLDNSSINSLMNVLSAINKARLKHAGKISGQIFRLYKKDMEVSFQDSKTGRKNKSMRPVIQMEYVPFDVYADLFKEVIQPDDWEALVALNKRSTLVSYAGIISDTSDPAQLENQTSTQALPGPEVSDEDAIRERMNHESVVPLFEELAKIMGVENSEEKRYNLAKTTPGVSVLIERLKSYISAANKKKEAVQLAASPPTLPQGPAKTPEVVVDQPKTEAPKVPGLVIAAQTNGLGKVTSSQDLF